MQVLCMGKGAEQSTHTRHGEEEKPVVPRVSMDYFFANQAGEETGSNPWIVMIDEETGEKYARVVQQKRNGRKRGNGLGHKRHVGGVKELGTHGRCRRTLNLEI